MEDRRENPVRHRPDMALVDEDPDQKEVAMNADLEVLRDMIPPTIRKTIYAVYLVAGIILGALMIALDASWLTTTQEVYVYLGVPVGAIALTNVVPNALVTATPAEHVEGEPKHLAE